ncbi:hypothetical protein RhiirC2_788944 [Rhizophagus irregularis]|uniref:Uncharacterized protein n=1 Tax=Rhizophagus irregularis TaxID=588596 RepID=A0A2N1MP62_9GLOM|nr:hypothetical protein RhiirC2_788944 [Rhizophagus irregularis]
MILPPFDASRRDESNDIWLDVIQSLDGRLFDFSHFYKNRIKPNRTAGFSVRFSRISALIRTVYNPDQTDPFGALANDNKYYAFIIVTWFEEINQNHVILECPLFRLLSANDQQWRRIFPITVIDQTNKIHFVRNEIDEQGENEESCWIKNEFYFTAV